MKPIIFSQHALFEMKRRNIGRESVEKVIVNPQQRLPSKKNRIILQNRYYDNERRREMLLRIVVEDKTTSFNVITAYKTSKIKKYWQGG